MKSPVIAAVLNFVIPGAGLIYVGRMYAAAANFAVAVIAPFTWVTFVEDGFDTVPLLTLAIAAGSAGFAHAAAGQSNAASERETPEPKDAHNLSGKSSA